MIFTLEVSEDMELENFKALCEFEVGIPTAEIALVASGIPLQGDQRKLMEFGIKDGDVIMLQRIQGARAISSPSQSGPPAGARGGGSGIYLSYRIKTRAI